jgi:ATP-dependent Clp protease protease subunit
MTAAGYMNSDCLAEEFTRRRIYLIGEITDSLAAEVCCQINHLAAMSHDDITLWIMSNGGSVSAGAAILDTMVTCGGCDIRTIVMGCAASMAAVIASSGTKGKRSIGPNASMMIHQASGGFSGQTADILRTAQYVEKVNKRLYEILAANCDVSVQQIATDCDRDYHLSAEEAIQYGLVDHIFSGFAE